MSETMEAMPSNLSQQDYAREAARLYREGVTPDEIRRITGFFVLSNSGQPLRFVQ